MSFILNALKKSEQERLAVQSDTLENRLHITEKEENKKPSIVMVFLVFINVVFLSYFIWTLVKQDEPPPIVKQPAPVIAEKITTTNKDVVSTENLNLKTVELPQQNSIAEQIKQQSKHGLTKNPSRHEVIKKPILPKRNTKQNTSKVVEEKVTAKSIIKSRQPIKPVIAVNNTDKVKGIPYLSELDYKFRRTVPAVEVNVYVYTENEADRFIMIAMKKYQAGQTMDSGIKLKQILMDSLVVEYNNRVFKIKRK